MEFCPECGITESESNFVSCNICGLYLCPSCADKHCKVDLDIDLEDRIWLFESLVGSHNYNLNDEDSDEDYKVFFLPNFDDLYNSKNYYNKIINEDMDIEAHDIRKVIDLWFKANINFLEVLFSEELKINPELDVFITDYLEILIGMKDEIAKMNLSYLYDACLGMHNEKMSKLQDGTSTTQFLVEKYGYDTKQALHAYRLLDFLDRFHKTDFEDFKGAIWYEDLEILNFKYGKYSLDEFKGIIKEKKKEIIPLEKEYKNNKIDEDLKIEIEDIVKRMVKEHIVDRR